MTGMARVEKIYRHENKYLINKVDEQLLSQRLPLVLRRDANVDENGGYFIRSLYFDDDYNTALQEKIDGVDPRSKIRIRTYHMTDKQIKLECKQKSNQYIFKQSLDITRSQCDALVSGDPRFLLDIDDTFARQMYIAFTTRKLRPKVIVDYFREAYVYPVEDVRVTLDKHIRTGLYSTDMFDKTTPTYFTQNYDTTVLEVKFNRYLAAYVRDVIQIGRIDHVAVSKYCICREYE